MSSLEDKRVLVSIDFGTYGCYVLYAHVSGCEAAQAVKFEGSPLVDYKKFPNAILMSKSGKNMIAYGERARREYTESKEQLMEEPTEESKERVGDMAYFENFKLHLVEHKQLNFDTNSPIPAVDGYPFPLCDLISECIKEIKKNTLLKYGEAEGQAALNALHEDHILWIISVPVLWTPVSRQAMRACCVEANIPAENVVIVDEPEAAASYLICETEEGKQLEPGDKYVCVDLGGGTFDMVCHKVREDRRLEEIHKEVGGLKGGRDVDERFFVLLENVFSKESVDAFKEECPAQYVVQKLSFQKRREKLPESVGPVKIVIELPLCEIAEDDQVHIQENARAFRVDGLDGPLAEAHRKSSGNWELFIQPRAWEWLFGEVLFEVKKVLKRLLLHRDCSDVRTVFMVGGLSKSEIIRSDLQRMFQDDAELAERRIRLSRPDHAELAVALGSLWMTDLHTIHGRRMKYTYGLWMEREYKRQDPIDKREPDPTYPHGFKTIDLFDALWYEGDPYGAGNILTVTREYVLVSGQRDVLFKIFQSTDEFVKFVDEPCCVEAGKWHYEVPREYISLKQQWLIVKFTMSERDLVLNVSLRLEDGTETNPQPARVKLPRNE